MSGWTEPTEKKEDLQNLVLKGCPLGQDFNNSKCPVSNVRKLAAENQVHYVNGLSEGQIDNILNYHEDCSCFFSFLNIETGLFPLTQKWGHA